MKRIDNLIALVCIGLLILQLSELANHKSLFVLAGLVLYGGAFCKGLKEVEKGNEDG